MWKPSDNYRLARRPCAPGWVDSQVVLQRAHWEVTSGETRWEDVEEVQLPAKDDECPRRLDDETLLALADSLEMRLNYLLTEPCHAVPEVVACIKAARWLLEQPTGNDFSQFAQRVDKINLNESAALEKGQG